MSVPERLKRFSYADYLSWVDQERYELIDGIPFAMTPAPSFEHQDILAELLTLFRNHLKGTNCKAVGAPFDVRLFGETLSNEKIDTVVQPDITIVCDKKKLDQYGCNGTPDLVIEILSPSSIKHDRWTKYKLYERAGIREYWIVDPTNQTIEVFKLTGSQYHLAGVYSREDELSVEIFSQLRIDISAIFQLKENES